MMHSDTHVYIIKSFFGKVLAFLVRIFSIFRFICVYWSTLRGQK